MDDRAGPIGFRHIETAPKDGTFVRLRFGQHSILSRADEEIGQWQEHEYMKAGGAWFDRDGFYVTPGPLFWAPATVYGDSSYD